MAFAVGAGIAAGSLVSGYFGGKAAGQQADAERQAADTQMAIYQQQRQDLMPYYQAGYNALDQINSNMGKWNQPFTQQEFTHDPSYQFRLDEGMNAVNRAAAASGGAVGGSALRSLGNYAQGAASTEYQAAFDRYQNQINNSYQRLAGIAGLGAGAINTGTAAGSNAAGGIANSISNMGGARAGGSLAMGNAINSGISQGIGAYQGNRLVNALEERNFPVSTPVATNSLPGGGSVATIDAGGLAQLRAG